MRFFTAVVDLGRELFNGMPILGASITAFFPLETYEMTRRFSQGCLGFVGRMILMAEHCGTHSGLSLPIRSNRAHGRPGDA
jgi:arylformamidase